MKRVRCAVSMTVELEVADSVLDASMTEEQMHEAIEAAHGKFTILDSFIVDSIFKIESI